MTVAVLAVVSPLSVVVMVLTVVVALVLALLLAVTGWWPFLVAIFSYFTNLFCNHA